MDEIDVEHANLLGYGCASFFLLSALVEVLSRKGLLDRSEVATIIEVTRDMLREEEPSDPRLKPINAAARLHLKALLQDVETSTPPH